MKNQLEQVDDYISGALSPVKMMEFNEAFEICPELARMGQIMRKGREYIKAQSMIDELENDPGQQKAEAMVDKYFSKEDVYNRKLNERGKRIIIGLSAAIVLALIILLLSYPFNIDSLQRLYARYYTPIDSKEIRNYTKSKRLDSRAIQGIECYAESRYEEAVDLFIKAGNEHFFLGMSYLGVLNYDKARLSLLACYIENPNHPGVNWYLGLTYIKLNDTERAIPHLQQLLNQSNPHQENAEKILNKLENR